MRTRLLWIVCGLGLAAVSARAEGGCTVPESDADAFAGSRAVAEVEVAASEPFFTATGAIRTRLKLTTTRVFKGELPEVFEIETPGGRIGRRADLRSDSLELLAGKTYVLMLRQDADGAWNAMPQKIFRDVAARPALRRYFANRARGPRPAAAATGTDQGPAGVPGSVVTPTGYSETSGQPTRFTRADGGLPVQYLIDIDPTKLPAGMTQDGAIAAVGEALQAWAGASSLRFEFGGVVAFGNAASSLAPGDFRLRIQLHDNFNAIANGNGTLGIGGGGFESASPVFTGGKVTAQGFQERLYGYVVMENPANQTSLNDVSVFKRVLTHEIGHALGLAHSSENPSEPDPILKAATMYYTTGTGTAGATIQAYDVDRIQFGYPVANTPPYTIDRLIPSVTTAPVYGTLPVAAGVNRLQLRGIDLQGTGLTAVLTDSGGGAFSLSGTTLVFDPGGFVGAPRLTDAEIAGGVFYDKAVVQFGDGVNLSRAATCTVIGFFTDTTPADGLPDTWMMANFGTKAVGAVGSGRNPKDDPDLDGLENRLEFYLNTDPNDAASGPVRPVYDHANRRIAFTPLRFAPYVLESSATLDPGSWNPRRMDTVFPVPGTLSFGLAGEPEPEREFYRVATGP